MPIKPSSTPVSPVFPQILRFAGLWLIYVSWCQAAGWVLSAFRSLHTTGYLSTAPVGLGLALWFWSATRPAAPTRLSLSKWRYRIKASPSLAAWCVVTLLILIGALINPPSNYDGLTYRLPKLLYWLQENRWHWIDALDFRLNITGAGFEWMSAPFILFTRSDRGLFLLNFLPFLLLPGLFFVAARGLGIRTRVARWWMWVWPMAYGIAMQAGSIGNDMVAAALALTSLAFAAQALRGKPWLCLFCSALAVAAMTGIKATTLPLGLPLGIYWLWVAWKTLAWPKTLALGTAVSPFALLVSFLPVAIACSIHTGKWNGNPNDRHGFEPKHPIAGLIGNSLEFAAGAISPPILPAAHSISQSLLGLFENQPWYLWTKKNYPLVGPSLTPEMPSEEGAGIGMGISFVCLVWAFSRCRPQRIQSFQRLEITPWLVASIWIAVAAFMCKSGIGGTKRLMVPFTPLIILGFLLMLSRARSLNPPHGRWLPLIPSLCLIPTLFLNPNRPLLPISYLMSLPQVPASVKSRMETVFSSYSRRSDLLASFRNRIPEGQPVGFAGNDHPATALFKPYGANRPVVDLSSRTQDSVRWIVGTPETLELRLGMPLKEWLPTSGFKKVYEEVIISRATTGPDRWMLFHKEP